MRVTEIRKIFIIRRIDHDKKDLESRAVFSAGFFFVIPMNEIIISEDGSNTLKSLKFNETYHSTFGAVRESSHIFIEAVLRPVAAQNKEINLFEVGFGTGLNTLLTFQFASENNLTVHYQAVEAYPVEQEIVKKLNYPVITGMEQEVLLKMHKQKNVWTEISGSFRLKVIKTTLQEVLLPQDYFHAVYFDAFSPETQPEMWQQSCFEKIFHAMRAGGMLSTYSSKGTVKRALKAAGFKIEKLPGPPGKREFVRAMKI
jgi:tRNA U34 5-methylaminomethyl-2-thiouridine-forming methyltransferase MnmC